MKIKHIRALIRQLEYLKTDYEIDFKDFKLCYAVPSIEYEKGKTKITELSIKIERREYE
jgi:hypothetical protein